MTGKKRIAARDVGRNIDDLLFPLEGGCDCEKIRYRMDEEPFMVHCCHCRWCQRETGASFEARSSNYKTGSLSTVRW